MASPFEAKMAAAVEDKTLAGAVLLATDTSASLNYAHVLGQSGIAPGAEAPLTIHTIFTLMSMTKLPTTLAVLQLVERGLLSLDEDMAPRLPALARQPVLTGFHPDTGRPLLEPRTRPLKLVHLLTHSAGTAYDFLHPTLAAYHAATGRTGPPQGMTPGAPLADRFAYPLLFQPGEGWVYGTGVDWAGLVVESVSGLRLEEYLAQHVFAPVGARDLTFFPARQAGMRARMWASLPVRDGETGRVVHTAPAWGEEGAGETEVCLGGAGMYGDVSEYLKVMESVLRDDGRILAPETAALMFEPQLEGEAARKALLAETANPHWIVGDIPDTGEYDWGLGGLLVSGDSHPWRKRGALMWSGMHNLTWIIDRRAGVAAIFASCLMPPGDAKAKELMRAWEEFIYPQAKL